jgi:protein TonB
MSNQSIFEKKWIEIVFENRNKEYGAYKLRQENPKTTLFAFLFGVVFLSTSVFVLSSFSSTDNVPIIDPYKDLVIKVDIFHPPTKEVEPIAQKAIAKKSPIKDDVKTKDLVDPIIVKADTKTDEIKTSEESKTTSNTSTEGSENGTATKTVFTNGTGKNPDNSGKGNETKTIENTATVDVLPKYPGGISNFYNFVARNFNAVDLNNETILTVYVSFVVEIDGTMTDIVVLRNPGYGMDKEAIRVLKSLKTKWEPGIKNGKPVRTQYTLPIKVKTS